MKLRKLYSDSEVRDMNTALDDFNMGKLQVKMRGGRHRSRQELFAKDTAVGVETDWVVLWTLLGPLLRPTLHSLATNAGQTDAELLKNLLHLAGSRDLPVAFEINPDPDDRSPDAWGRIILSTLVKALFTAQNTSRDALRVGATVGEGGRPLDGEEVEKSLETVDLIIEHIARPLAELLGTPIESKKQYDRNDRPGEVAKKIWLGGIIRPQPPVHSFPGLKHVAVAIAEQVCWSSPFAASSSESSPAERVYRGIRSIPEDIADKFFGNDNIKRLLSHRDAVRNSYPEYITGISESGTSEVDLLAFSNIFGPKQPSTLLSAPTSAGKTRFGQLAVIEAIHRRKSSGAEYGEALVLAPSKALVGQIAEDFRDLLQGTVAKDWSIVEGTRDHPQYNDTLRSGRFDIAVVIPEKLSAMLRLGLSVRDCPIIVVDEFQHLVDGQRGLNLEMLLIELFERHPEKRWVALSASLGHRTENLITRWLSQNNVHYTFLRASHRPVPLAVRATGRTTEIETLAGAGSQGRPSKRRPFSLEHNKVPAQHKVDRHRARILDVVFSAIRSQITSSPSGDFPSVIVFTNSKAKAEQLADSTRHYLPQLLAGPTPDAAIGAIEGSRFKARTKEGHERDVTRLHTRLTQSSPTTIRNRIEDAIRSGIGFHTGTLDPNARALIESAFRSGIVRILYATDTLKLGVNLPSDIVINADMDLSVGGNRGFFLLDQDSVIQRLGRAGRLGLSTRGIGVLVVPDPADFPPMDRKNNTEREVTVRLPELQGLGNGSTSVALRKASDTNSVYTHFLQEWHGGAEYNPPATDTWLESASLRLALIERSNSSAQTFRSSVQDLYNRSLVRQTDRDRDVTQLCVLDNLVADGILDLPLDGSVRLTNVGWALASNAVQVNNATAIDLIAQAARNGAGPLTLLMLAFEAPLVMWATDDLKVQSTKPGHYDEIRRYAKQTLALTRDSKPRLFANLPEKVVDMIGEGIEADDLRWFIESTDQSSERLERLLRASVLARWWAGLDFKDIEHVPGRTVSEMAVRKFAEMASYIIAAASDIDGIDPSDMTFRVLQRFAGEVESGLPRTLNSLTLIAHPALDRTRVLGMLYLLDDQTRRWDYVKDLLRQYVEDSGGIPKGTSRAERQHWTRLDETTVREIETLLDHEESRRRSLYNFLPKRVTDKRVPSDSAITLGDQLERLLDESYRVLVVEDLLYSLGFERGEDADMWRVDHSDGPKYRRLAIRSFLDDGTEHLTFVRVVPPDQLVTHSYLDEVRADLPANANEIVVDMGGCSDGVYTSSDFISDRCAVVHPNLLVEMIGRVYDETSEDVDREDFERSVSLVRRLLVNNAPVLSREDVENRLASLNISTRRVSAS